MALLAGVNYDPAVAVAKATSSLLAMTAIDATNVTVSFTAPVNGNVLVRARVNLNGATTFPQILLGIMQHSGGAVVARQCPIGGILGTAVATTNVPQEVLFTVTGLSGTVTWDLGYAVQVLLASTNIHYGGPNDTTTNNAWGGIEFEVWEAPDLIASILYDPGTAATKSTNTSLVAMTAIDTTNLRMTITAPASGNILFRLRGVVTGATTFPQILLGVLESTTVVGRAVPIGAIKGTALATSQLAQEAQFIATGVSAGSHTYDAAYGTEVIVASSNLRYGGPNDALGNDAFGGFLFEAWSI